MIAAPPEPQTSSFSAAAASDAPPQVVHAPAAWAALPGGVLDGGELVLLAIKPSLWRPVFDSAPWLVTSVLLAGTLIALGRPLPGLGLATTAQLVLLVGVLRLAVATFRWIPRWHVLTNRRIIDIHGVRVPRIVSCPLISIRNTYLRGTTPERVVGIGSITFSLDAAEAALRVWRSIATPEEVHARVRRAIENAIDQQNL